MTASRTADELAVLDATEQAGLVRRGELTAKELVEAAVDRLADLYERHERGEPLYGKAAARVVSEFGAIAADVTTVEVEGQAGVDGGLSRSDARLPA